MLTVSAESRKPERLAARQVDAGLVLRPSTSEEFLPSVRPWVRLLGLVMLGSFVSAVGLMAVWPYRVVVRGSGQIRPTGETSVIHAPLSGRVRSVDARANQTVRRAQVIAVLDPADLEGRREQLASSRSALERELEALRSQNRAAVQGAELQVEKAQAALQLAQSEFNRFQLLRDSGAIAPLQLDEKAANLEVASSDLAKARRAVEEVRFRDNAQLSRLAQEFAANSGERAQVSRDLGITLVRAPVDGVLFSMQLFNPQQVVQQGQELARIAPSGRGLVAKMTVASEDIDNVKPGQRVDLRLAGCPFPDFGTLRGTVRSVSPDVIRPAAAQAPPQSPAPSAAGTSSGYEVTVVPHTTVMRSGSRRCDVRLGMNFTADITTRMETVLRFVLRKGRFVLPT
jgi:multidrug efflux pump subunit AcrA (membrane-fusion protein)